MPGTLRSLLVLSTLLTAPALAAPPSQIRAEYKLALEEIEVAEISETFTRTENRYRIESVTRATGLAAMLKPETIQIVSEGEVTAQGLHPLRMTQQRTREPERNTRAAFDWESHTLALTEHNLTRSVSLPEDTQDRLSAMYQFMFLQLQGKDELAFHMTNGSKLDSYHYQLKPGQSVTVPLGETKALFASTLPQPDRSKTEIWLATERDQLPVKVVVTENDGMRFTQTLTRLTITP